MSTKPKEHIETESTGPDSYVINRTQLSIDPTTNDSTFVYESMPQIISKGRINKKPAFRLEFYLKNGQWHSSNPNHDLDEMNSWLDVFRSYFDKKNDNLTYFK